MKILNFAFENSFAYFVSFVFNFLFAVKSLVNLFNTGWYPILQGRLYSNLPGQSASLMAIGAVTTPLGKFLPFLIGLLADQFGLQNAVWVLLLGPIALLIGLPRQSSNPPIL